MLSENCPYLGATRFLVAICPRCSPVLSINLSADVFVFGDFDIHHKGRLTFSGGIDRPGEPCYNFSI